MVYLVVPMQLIRTAGLILAAIVLAAPAPAFGQDLNLSQDLQRLGVSANMEPNRSNLDSRPLFQAAIEYVRQRHITRVTLDPGDYFFLTPQPNGRYIYDLSANNLTEVEVLFPPGTRFSVLDKFFDKETQTWHIGLEDIP